MYVDICSRAGYLEQQYATRMRGWNLENAGTKLTLKQLKERLPMLEFMEAASRSKVEWEKESSAPKGAMDAAAWLARHTPKEVDKHIEKTMATVRQLAKRYRVNGEQP